jgi:hypothetical protein
MENGKHEAVNASAVMSTNLTGAVSRRAGLGVTARVSRLASVADSIRIVSLASLLVTVPPEHLPPE